MTSVFRCLQIPGLLLAAALLTGCDQPPPEPFFEITKAEVKQRSFGGPNRGLMYQVAAVFDSGGRTIEVVQVVDGQEHVAYAFTGHGWVSFSLDLIGCFLNTGEVAKLEAMAESLEFEPSWRTDFPGGRGVTFLRYTGLEGRQVSYSVRLMEGSGKPD